MKPFLVQYILMYNIYTPTTNEGSSHIKSSNYDLFPWKNEAYILGSQITLWQYYLSMQYSVSKCTKHTLSNIHILIWKDTC